MPTLDFKELSTSRASSAAGEDLEGLVRELGKATFPTDPSFLFPETSSMHSVNEGDGTPTRPIASVPQP
jgi:hypothetical protein